MWKKNMEEKMKILIARKNATKQKRDSAAESIERMKKYGDLFRFRFRVGIGI